MRNFIILLFFVGVQIMNSSCKKKNLNEENVALIVGKWKLSEVYSDPGDGSGKFIKVNGGKIIEFTAEGKISSNSKLCFMHTNGDSEVSTYIIYEESGNKNKLKIEKCGFEHNYELKGNQLTIYYPCIEGCGERFVRVTD